MRLFKICLIALVALFSTTFVAEAQQRSTRYTLGDVSNNEIADSVDFDLNAPVLTEGDGKLYHIRKINLHGVKYLNHDILKSSAGLQEGDSVYLPSKFISNAMTRLWAPRYFSDIQIGATIEGDSVDLEVFLKERARILNWTITGVSKSKAKDLQEEVLKLRRNTELSDYVIDKNEKLIRKHFVDKGFRNTEVKAIVTNDSVIKNAVNVTFRIDRKSKVRVGEITFEGNENFDDKRLRKSFKKTHQRSINIFRNTKLKDKDYAEDKELLRFGSDGFRIGIEFESKNKDNLLEYAVFCFENDHCDVVFRKHWMFNRANLSCNNIAFYSNIFGFCIKHITNAFSYIVNLLSNLH